MQISQILAFRGGLIGYVPLNLFMDAHSKGPVFPSSRRSIRTPKASFSSRTNEPVGDRQVSRIFSMFGGFHECGI
jgi:hypothetical protein